MVAPPTLEGKLAVYSSNSVSLSSDLASGQRVRKEPILRVGKVKSREEGQWLATKRRPRN